MIYNLLNAYSLFNENHLAQLPKGVTVITKTVTLHGPQPGFGFQYNGISYHIEWNGGANFTTKARTPFPSSPVRCVRKGDNIISAVEASIKYVENSIFHQFVETIVGHDRDRGDRVKRVFLMDDVPDVPYDIIEIIPDKKVATLRIDGSIKAVVAFRPQKYSCYQARVAGSSSVIRVEAHDPYLLKQKLRKAVQRAQTGRYHA